MRATTDLAELRSSASLHNAVIFFGHLPSSTLTMAPNFGTFNVPPNDYPSPSALASPTCIRLFTQSSRAYCGEAEYAKTAVALPPAVIVYHDTTVLEGQDINIQSSLASTIQTIVTF